MQGCSGRDNCVGASVSILGENVVVNVGNISSQLSQCPEADHG